jgi:hypothetical protein
VYLLLFLLELVILSVVMAVAAGLAILVQTQTVVPVVVVGTQDKTLVLAQLIKVMLGPKAMSLSQKVVVVVALDRLETPAAQLVLVERV